MKVCVFGAGAVGGHLAVRLSAGGADVSAVMRGANLEAVRARGLELRRDGADPSRVDLPVSDQPADLGVQDVVVFSVKYRALAAALEAAGPLIGPETHVVGAMNGMPWWFADGLELAESEALAKLLDPGGTFSATVPAERWTACVVASGNVVSEPGVITNTTATNKLRLGNSAGTVEPMMEEFAQLAERGGYDACVVDDVRRHIWSKLLINGGISSVATVCEQTIAEVCQAARTRAISIAIISEIMAIGDAIGLSVEADPTAMTDPERAPPHITSFLQDLKAGRPLEIENGILALTAIACAAAVSAPHLEAIAAVMLARSNGSTLD